MTQKAKRSIGLPIVSGILLLLLVAMICFVALKPGGSAFGYPLGFNDSGAHLAAKEYYGVSVLYLEAGSTDVVLIPSEDDALRVPADDSITVDYDEEDGTLWIVRQTSPFRVPMFWWSAEASPIHIEVPYVDAIGVETTSGSITASNLRSEYLHLSSTSGEILVSDADVAGDITASSSSGNIRVDRFYAASIYTSANSGDVHLGEAYCPDVSIFTQSGSQWISTQTGAELYCYSESGNIDLAPAQPALGWVRTSSGDVLFSFIQGPQSILFSTSSGRATLNREDIVQSADSVYTDTIHYDIGGKGPDLEIYTGSGNLTID